VSGHITVLSALMALITQSAAAFGVTSVGLATALAEDIAVAAMANPAPVTFTPLEVPR
jgi:hypothetical protein